MSKEEKRVVTDKVSVVQGIYCRVLIDTNGVRLIDAVGKWPTGSSKRDICKGLHILEGSFDKRVLRLVDVPATIWEVLPWLAKYYSHHAYMVAEPFSVPFRWITREEYDLLTGSLKQVVSIGERTQGLRHDLHIRTGMLQEAKAVLRSCGRRLDKLYINLPSQQASDAQGIKRLCHKIQKVVSEIEIMLPKGKK